MTKTFIKLFQCCFLTKGVKRSLIIDTQRGNFHFIPNELYELLSQPYDIPVSVILEGYDLENATTVLEYFDFLIEKELAFYTDEPQNFPPVSKEYHEPRLISNAIVDIAEHSTYKLEDVIRQIDQLGTEAILIRIYYGCSFGFLYEVCRMLNQTRRLRTVELIIKYTSELDVDQIEKLVNYCPLFSQITIHSSTESEHKHQIKTCAVYFVKQAITSSEHCGFVSPTYFTTSISHVTESFLFNTCLNKKISVDVDGNIKNCPTMRNSFGNVQDTLLSTAILKPEFRYLWDIHKEKINTCKDCEFRNVCIDCRALTKDNDPLGKPMRCTYDPYTATWLKN